MKSTPLFLLLVALFLSFGTSAQPEKPLTAAEQSEVIDSINALLLRTYVFPEKAEEMAMHLKQRLKSGQYKDVLEGDAFAELLTADLRSISKDLHLRVGFAPKQISEMRAMADDPPSDRADFFRESMRQGNFGFQEVNILDGNIGYLDLRGFTDAAYGGETAVAAMNFLANTNALIFDLRQNGGGSPSMIQLLTSYLYGPEPVHLNNFYWRPTNTNTQTWTLPHVPGQRMPDIPVYVLTSSRTFSAAEEFSYNLKNLERATLIGETTGGGAHPGGTEIATDRFTIWVPHGRAINPISGTNWEGTGVQPHIEVPQEQALDKAHLTALQQLAQQAKNDTEKERYSWFLLPLQVQLEPVEIDAATLQRYVGNYGPRQLLLEDGALYYQREGNPKYKLTALDRDLFMFAEAPYFRLKVVQKNGVISGLEGQYDNGRTDFSPRDKS